MLAFGEKQPGGLPTCYLRSLNTGVTKMQQKPDSNRSSAVLQLVPTMPRPRASMRYYCTYETSCCSEFFCTSNKLLVFYIYLLFLKEESLITAENNCHLKTSEQFSILQNKQFCIQCCTLTMPIHNFNRNYSVSEKLLILKLFQL